MRLFPLLPALLLLCGLSLGTPSLTPSASAMPIIDGPAEVVVSLPDLFGIDLNDALKVGGVLVVVNEFGDEINDFINELLDNNDAKTNAATKVVVIVSPVSGKYIGAAQVTGPREAVARVKAVAQLEKSFKKAIRVKAMVPIANEKGNDITRVQGVAVSAVIDIRI